MRKCKNEKEKVENNARYEINTRKNMMKNTMIREKKRKKRKTTHKSEEN